MSDESRKDPRARIAGVRAAYERAGGDTSDDEVLNLGRGGVFIATTKPLAVGKLVHVELSVPGDSDALSATGRVIWIREIAVNDARPAGMGVKFIDVEEGALEVIGRMIREHEPSPKPGPAAPAREKTIMGVGQAPPPSTPPPPMPGEAKVVVAEDPRPEPKAEPKPKPEPKPEATSEPTSEPKRKAAPDEFDPEAKTEPRRAPITTAKAPAKSGGNGKLLLIAIVAVAVAAIVYWDRIVAMLGK